MKILKSDDIIFSMTNAKKLIEKVPLESTTGTKKMQQAFHKQAVIERNTIIEKEKNKNLTYQREIYKELLKRKNKLLPIDNQELYTKSLKQIILVKELLKLTSDITTYDYKLNLNVLISKTDNDKTTSLKEINNIIKEFILKLKNASINLSFDDFNYNMYTISYMKTFLENINNSSFDTIIKTSFENIYWDCPLLISNIRLNMLQIVKKHSKKLLEYTTALTNNKLKEANITPNNLISTYNTLITNYYLTKSKDGFINLNLFLSKKLDITNYLKTSPTIVKNFDSLCINNDYNSLDNNKKEDFCKEINKLYYTLKDLKNYYLFEPIIKDLIEKYKKKEENKTSYLTKEKEIKTKEQEIAKINKEYKKASGIGFLAKINPTKQKDLKMQMNDVVNNVIALNKELNDLEIVNNINKYINNNSSIYDLLLVSNASYNYLEKIIIDTYKDKESFDLEQMLTRYSDFIYSPNNQFMKKLPIEADYDICDIITDKFSLVGINIKKEDLTKDNIDSKLDTIRYVKLVNDINSTELSLENIDFIYNINNIDYKYEEII